MSAAAVPVLRSGTTLQALSGTYGLCAPCANEAWRDTIKLEEFCDTACQGSRWASDNWSRFLEEVRRKFGEKPNAVQYEQGDDDDMDLFTQRTGW